MNPQAPARDSPIPMPPLLAGILIGGDSTRMGQPKHLLRAGGRLLIERIVCVLRPCVQQVVLLGAGVAPASVAELPRCGDAGGLRGPLAGMLAAMRWRPDAAWLIAACDMPNITPRAVEWLIGQRRPDCLATLPRVHDRHVEPLLAIYEARAAAAFEQLAASDKPSPQRMAAWPGVAVVDVPAALRSAWTNANTPTDFEAALGLGR